MTHTKVKLPKRIDTWCLRCRGLPDRRAGVAKDGGVEPACEGAVTFIGSSADPYKVRMLVIYANDKISPGARTIVANGLVGMELSKLRSSVTWQVREGSFLR